MICSLGITMSKPQQTFTNQKYKKEERNTLSKGYQLFLQAQMFFSLFLLSFLLLSLHDNCLLFLIDQC